MSGNAGGGISGRSVTVANSTVDGNHGSAGISGHFVTVTNSTISGNAGGLTVHGYAIAHVTDLGILHLNSSTIAGNTTTSEDFGGGGVYFFISEAYIANSIVAGNSSAIGSPDIDRPNAGATLVSNGHNIFGSVVEGAAASDFQNIPAYLLFAGGLSDHGGPTETLALRGASDNPALGGADPVDSPAIDQRGEARPQPTGTDPDVGAFESAWAPTDPQRPFDSLEYIASYRDLIDALGPDPAAGYAHYHQYGAGEGRTVTFDGLEYIASYDDLIQALGANADAGAAHYITHGVHERRAPDDFDAEQYLKNYADLQAAFGDDTHAATIHFITYGFAEHRTDQPLTAHGASDFLL